MVVLGTRWKNKTSEAFALSNPMSKVISELQSSLIQSKACGLLLDHSGVLLEVELKQADLLNQACFGCSIVTADRDKQQYELSLEEAFYLSHSLNCLKIIWRGKCLKADDDLWELLKSKNELFPIYYKAYSHLREKNWVVKSEIKYGVHFVAYRHHPSLVHSEYAVVVSTGDVNPRLMAWSSLHATIRLEDGVAKTLLALHIKNKAYCTDSSSCLKRFMVEEQVITRWNPALYNEDRNIVDKEIGNSGDFFKNSETSPHYKFCKFSISSKFSPTNPSLMVSGLNTRWKGKGSKAIALATPMSDLITKLQVSLVHSKTCGMLMDFAAQLEVRCEQADLLNQTCFGCPVISTNGDTHQYELSLEETFYLVHSLNCIEITVNNWCLKDNDELWDLMKSKRKLFPVYYKAYSHLRAKNWVVRSGIQYGVDFVAYRHHPSLVHSEYAVIVSESNDAINTRLVTWPDVHATVRLEGGVAKTLLVLHIQRNGYSTGSSSCLKHYTVEEQIITRWNSERCREDKNLVKLRTQ